MGGIENRQESLARLVVERVLAEGGLNPYVDSDAFAVRYGVDSVLYLEELHEEASSTSALAHEAHVAHFVATKMSSNDWPANWGEALPRVRPVLKPSTYTLGSPSGLLLSRRVFPLIDELVVVDMPGHSTAVTWSTIDEWGVDPNTVFAAARSNLAIITQHADPTKGRAIQRLVENPSQGARHFTSWLLDPGWLASHRGRFGCPPIAFVPDVNTIIVLPSDDDQLLAKHFRSVEEQYVHTARGLSPQAYTVDGTGAVITLDQVRPDDAGAGRARCVHIAKEYAAQTSWLTRQFELDHVHSSPAGVTVKHTPFGPRTVTIWANDIDIAMPQTDLVAFCRADEAPFYVQFEDVLALTHILPVNGLDPARYRVTDWPPPEIVEQLRAHSISVD